MLRRIRELATRKETFAFETTMASRSFLPFLNQCKRQGYRVQLIYIWLMSADLSVARVAQRVECGGHHVPEKIIRTRYQRGLQNFLSLYSPIADGWALYDNSSNGPLLIAEKSKREEIRVVIPDLWSTFQEAFHESAR